MPLSKQDNAKAKKSTKRGSGPGGTTKHLIKKGTKSKGSTKAVK